MFIVSVVALTLAVAGAAPDAQAAEKSAASTQALEKKNDVARFDASRCRSIADLSSPARPIYQENENGEWECSYMLEYPETSHTPSVFIQIRGVEPGVWRSFRLKLNFGSILSRQVLGNRAANLVYALIGNETPMRELGVTLAEGQEFELSFANITLRYKQERMDNMRFNLSGNNVGLTPPATTTP